MPEPVPPTRPPAADPPAADPPATGTSRPGGPPGSSTFSLEGRAAPGLYLLGWLCTILGLPIVATSILSGGAVASPWLFGVGMLLLSVGLVAAAGSQALERAQRPDVPFRGPSPWLTFAAAIALTILLSLAVVIPLSAFGLDVTSPAASAIGLAITAFIYFGLVRLLVVGTGALSWREMGVGQRLPDAFREILFGGAFALPVLFVTGALVAVLLQFLPRPPSPLPVAVDTTGLLFNAFSAVILAPIGEELFFRGYATTAWERSIGARGAIVRGALFFALAHVLTVFDFQEAVFAFLVRLPVGLALGWLFLSRRSLAASIGLHAAFNGIQLLALAGAPGP